MLQTPPIPHSWKELVPYAIAIFLVYLFSGLFGGSLILAAVAVVSLWLNRNKPAAEIHLSEAQTELTRAQTRKTEGEIFDEMHERVNLLVKELDQAGVTIRILDAQVERARRAGFLERDEKGGTGPNPAA